MAGGLTSIAIQIVSSNTTKNQTVTHHYPRERPHIGGTSFGDSSVALALTKLARTDDAKPVSISGEVTGPLYLLGTLHTSGHAAEIIFKRPNPANPTLRGADTLPPRANGKPRFKYLPVQLVDRPVQFTKNPTPAPNKVLALQLTGVGNN